MKAKDESKRVLARSTLSMYLLQIAKYIFPFITLPYLARVLGTDGYAIRSYVLSNMTFVSMVAEFGFMNYAIALLVRDGLNSRNASEISSSIMIARFCLFIPLAAAVALMNCTVPLMGKNSLYVWISFAGTFFSSLLPDFVFRGYERMEIITLRYVVSKGASVLLTFILINDPDDLLLVPILDVFTSVVAFVWSWAAAIQQFGVRFVPVAPSRVWNDFVQSAVYFVSGVSTIVFSSLTTFLFGVYGRSPEDIAYWGVAMTVMNGLSALYAPLSQSLYPHFLKKANDDGGSLSLRRMYAVSLVPLTLVAISMVIFSRQIMWVLGGDQYLDGSYVIAILAPFAIASFYVQLSGWPSLGALGKVKELTTTTVIGTAFHAAELLLLIVFTGYDLKYVTFARVLSESVMALLRLVECKRAGII